MARRTPRVFLTATTARLSGLLVALLLLSGCSSVFFYPDRVTYITPDRLNLEYEDIYLDTADGETLHGVVKQTYLRGEPAAVGRGVAL